MEIIYNSLPKYYPNFQFLLHKYCIAKDSNDQGTFGKEAVPDRDPVRGVRGSGDTACLPSIISLELTGESKHGCTAMICLVLPHAALCCCEYA